MNPKQEAEKLMNEILPVAKRMLRQHGEFLPYGGYMKPNGEIVHVGAKDPETDRPKSMDLISILRNSFRRMAKNKECIVAVTVFDVVVTIPESNRKSDAIQVSVDHIDNYSADVFFPYQIIEDKVVFGEIFAQEGKHEVFESE